MNFHDATHFTKATACIDYILIPYFPVSSHQKVNLIYGTGKNDCWYWVTIEFVLGL